MRRGRHLLFALALWLGSCAAAQSQDGSQLAADRLWIESDNRLIAEGNVEIFHEGARLHAERVVFIRGATPNEDRLEIVGPITLELDRRTVVFGDEAELAPDLRDGVMRGARLILSNQIQMAADSILREGGRFTRLDNAVVSSCRICARNPVPLWEIRARSVEHDNETSQITYEWAQFRVIGYPVAIIPRLRMPDPTVDRATGFLAPVISNSQKIGFGVQLPYFIALAPDRDLLLTPRVTTEGSLTFGARYRQAYRTGLLTLDGALTYDNLRREQPRGFARVAGSFRVFDGARLTFRLLKFSDDSYFDDYGDDIAGRDSFVQLSRLRRDTDILFRITQFDNPRQGVRDNTQPNLEGQARAIRRFPMPVVGGLGRLVFTAYAAKRDSNDPTRGIGRDQAQAALQLDWRRNWLLAGGVEVSGLANILADYTSIRQDDRFPPNVARFLPAVAVEARWPLERSGSSGARHLLEPVAQLVLASTVSTNIPNETSRLVEFTEATLFALNRYPGTDKREPGTRLNVGLSWSRIDPQGWDFTVLGGRVFRAENVDFSRLSGLGGTESDWLAAARLSVGALELLGRTVIDDSGGMPKQELRVAYATDVFEAGGRYLRVVADPQENRPDPTTEIGINGTYKVDPNWEVRAETNYDLLRNEPLSGFVGARFRNECVALDVFFSRRFDSSTSVGTFTEWGVQFNLLGFGSSRVGPVRSCAR